MVLEHDGGLAPAATDERDSNPGSFERAQSGPEAPQHEAHSLRAREVDAPGVALHREVITEPLGLIIRVDVTADPCQETHVVQDVELGLVEPEVLAHAPRDDVLAHRVLHGLAQSEIGAERQHRQQLGESNVRGRPVVGHG